MMDHWRMSVQFVDMFPVDVHPRANGSFSTARLESFVPHIKKAFVISCVSLDSIARANASQLKFLLKYLTDASLVLSAFPKLRWNHSALEHRLGT
ncbi:hypothetical protein JG687_00014836 [Phytophthora cactorum]|uniref:Uncharacterized protein n=1 Tax=Phytophthora cactorum TaxID=29920 RepID=A0A329RPU8_9STRA|nr:hypothetical protein Pcac1_g7791 [Phytophthora cactorum]KAG2800953.1 hypothetical protein PC112_g20247 [Phytophthora cactorum]KAG2801573.1 hypothetical protein PC111_g19488 [Phytophthora cactorum]KAG2841189.1 hypothetical protein PC113_g19085 [Phytophthora cactorum]KAG2880008.1 hypothetical protein PC114_g22271 [Phytophthora cactorum]